MKRLLMKLLAPMVRKLVQEDLHARQNDVEGVVQSAIARHLRVCGRLHHTGESRVR
jgi:hypothetical protein